MEENKPKPRPMEYIGGNTDPKAGDPAKKISRMRMCPHCMRFSKDATECQLCKKPLK